MPVKITEVPAAIDFGTRTAAADARCPRRTGTGAVRGPRLCNFSQFLRALAPARLEIGLVIVRPLRDGVISYYSIASIGLCLIHLLPARLGKVPIPWGRTAAEAGGAHRGVIRGRSDCGEDAARLGGSWAPSAAAQSSVSGRDVTGAAGIGAPAENPFMANQSHSAWFIHAA